jgi:phospholipase C
MRGIAWFLGCLAVAALALDHVVVVMLENQSFDRLFGQLPGARGFGNATYCNPLPQGGKDCLKRDAPLSAHM